MELKELYKLRSVLESGNDNKKETKEEKIDELENKMTDIDKKETRGFISDDEADEEREKIRKKLAEIKENENE